MRITMLGTGHAVVTDCYNTCFVLSDDGGLSLLVDGGGGAGIVAQMRRAGIGWTSIHEVFVTHKHIDHLLGIVWVLRMVGMEMRRGTYEGRCASTATKRPWERLRVWSTSSYGMRIQVLWVHGSS